MWQEMPSFGQARYSPRSLLIDASRCDPSTVNRRRMSRGDRTTAAGARVRLTQPHEARRDLVERAVFLGEARRLVRDANSAR
jgi:hypothetical protein